METDTGRTHPRQGCRMSLDKRLSPRECWTRPGKPASRISGMGQDMRQEVLLHSRWRCGHATEENDSVVGIRVE